MARRCRVISAQGKRCQMEVHGPNEPHQVKEGANEWHWVTMHQRRQADKLVAAQRKEFARLNPKETDYRKRAAATAKAIVDMLDVNSVNITRDLIFDAIVLEYERGEEAGSGNPRAG